MAFIPIYLILIPIITAMFIYVFNRQFFNHIVFIAQLVLTFLSIHYYQFYDGLVNKQVLYIGGHHEVIAISLRNDQLSIFFVFLTIFMWWMVLIYCWGKHKGDFKYLFFLMFLQGTFLGLLQTNDLFNLFIFIEITTIISTILIIYKKDGYAVRAGLYYLLFNSVGMIFYLLGLIFLYVMTGSLNMDIIGGKITEMNNNSVIILSYILIMAAIGVKSAFFPVYNWLPKAHSAAPASISALLSGLLIKSGVYAFIRFNAIYQIETLLNLFFIIGFITAIFGILFALSQKDIKQILAFHTISQVGIIIMGLSSQSDYAYYGGILHLFNHAIFKSLLFMGTGTIINYYGTRRITEMRGVFKTMPFISILMIIGMLSITGAPLFNGYVSKTMIKYGFQDNNLKLTMLYLVNIGTATSFVKMSQIFFGSKTSIQIGHFNHKVVLSILSIVCLIFGIFYAPIMKQLFGVDLSFVKWNTIMSWLHYLLVLVIGYFIFKFVIDKDYLLIKKLRHLDISFETTNFMLIMFIFIMIVWEKFIS